MGFLASVNGPGGRSAGVVTPAPPPTLSMAVPVLTHADAPCMPHFVRPDPGTHRPWRRAVLALLGCGLVAFTACSTEYEPKAIDAQRVEKLAADPILDQLPPEWDVSKRLILQPEIYATGPGITTWSEIHASFDVDPDQLLRDIGTALVGAFDNTGWSQVRAICNTRPETGREDLGSISIIGEKDIDGRQATLVIAIDWGEADAGEVNAGRLEGAVQLERNTERLPLDPRDVGCLELSP